MVKVPGIENNGVRNDTPVISSDFYPTILDLAGLPLRPKDHIDGKSIVPVIKGRKFEERPLYWHYPHYGNQGGRPVSIMRKGVWKLIHFWEDGHNELYNLNTDIHEDHNLAVTESKRTSEMSKKLLNWLKEVGAQSPKPNPSFDETKEKETITNNQKQKTKLLEELRLQMLNKDWKPNPNWWGSIPTID